MRSTLFYIILEKDVQMNGVNAIIDNGTRRIQDKVPLEV